MLISLGDLQFAEFMREFEASVRKLIELHGGQEIDKTDGFLIVFDSGLDATRFALACQQSMAQPGWLSDTRVRLRIGLHRGQVVVRSNNEHDVARGAKRFDVDGLCKVTAARLMSLALPGQVLATREIFDVSRASGEQVSQKGDVQWVAHGHYIFHGFDGVLEIFEIGREPYAPLRPPPDSPKARRSVSADEERTLGWRPARGKTVPSAPEWVLETKVGQGGYGEVWSARHHENQTQLCILKFCFQPDRLRALKREATLFRVLKTALRQRNDIARILSWNFLRYPYYLQLEYSDCPDLHGWVLAQGGWEQISMEQRIELVAAVADAVDGAHQAGVLHKDIKPSNVLAGKRKGLLRVLLIDFGVGMLMPSETKPLTLTGLTETMSTSGTRIYMAPELQEGQAPSIRSDVYSLGVLLFQTVAGDFSKSLSVGWEDYIPDPLLRADIAACVDGTPERRLPTAAALALALRSLPERHEEARRLHEQQLAEEQGRKRAIVNARRIRYLSGTVALLLIAGAATAYLAVKAQRAEVEANLRLRESLEANRAAEAARQEMSEERAAAEDLVGFMLNDLSSQLKKVSRLNLMDGVTTKALDYFNRHPGEEVTDQQQLLRAKALVQLGDLTLSRGSYVESEKAFDQARILASTLYDETRQYEAGATAAYALEKLGMISEAEGIPALSFYTDSLHLRTALWYQSPEDHSRVKLVADTFERLGYYWRWYTDRPIASSHHLRMAFRLRKHILHYNQDNVDYIRGLALSYRQYGLAHTGDSRFQLDMLQKSLNLFNRALRSDPRDRSVKLMTLEVMRKQAELMFPRTSHWRSGMAKLNHIIQYTKSELVAEPDRLDNLTGVFQALTLRAGYNWVGGNDRGMLEDLRDLVFWSHKLKTSDENTFVKGTEKGIALGIGNNSWRAMATAPATSKSLSLLTERLKHDCAEAADHASSARMLAVMEKEEPAAFEEFLKTYYPRYTTRWPDMHRPRNDHNPPSETTTPLKKKRFWRLDMLSKIPRQCMIRLYQPNANVPYYAFITSGAEGALSVCTGPHRTNCWIQVDNYPPQQLSDLIQPDKFAPDKTLVTLNNPDDANTASAQVEPGP